MSTKSNHLPTDAKERKNIPLWSGLVKYFPDALVAVAKVSKAGNDQHNGKDSPLHWSREKSSDHEDTLLRHLLDSGTLDIDGYRHSAKVAWRALAMLQLEIEEANRNQYTARALPQSETAYDANKIQSTFTLSSQCLDTQELAQAQQQAFGYTLPLKTQDNTFAHDTGMGNAKGRQR